MARRRQQRAQFRITRETHHTLETLALPGETPNLAARRLLLEYLELLSDEESGVAAQREELLKNELRMHVARGQRVLARMETILYPIEEFDE